MTKILLILLNIYSLFNYLLNFPNTDIKTFIFFVSATLPSI